MTRTTKGPGLGGPLLVARALDFAARAHVEQRRKGVAAEPYVNHLAEVAALLAEAMPDDAALIAAGLLHDAVEDTATTGAELAAAFGPDVAALVAEVTDDKSLPKQERKRLQVATAHAKSRRARMLKLADKTSNLRALVKSPPDAWDLERRRRYVAWAAEVVAGCRGVDASLEAAFDAAWEEARAWLAARDET
jgi:(p)ppGpp synthase/HD superfamily hydrolase